MSHCREHPIEIQGIAPRLQAEREWLGQGDDALHAEGRVQDVEVLLPRLPASDQSSQVSQQRGAQPSGAGECGRV